MAIYRPASQNQTEAGYAIYESDAERRRSFWLENLWDGSVLDNTQNA